MKSEPCEPNSCCSPNQNSGHRCQRWCKHWFDLCRGPTWRRECSMEILLGEQMTRTQISYDGSKTRAFQVIYFVRLAPSREGKTWKKKQRSLLVPPVHNHSFFMVTKECILWSMVCIVHTKQYLDRRFIPFYCILWLDYMQMHLIKQDYGVRFAEC